MSDKYNGEKVLVFTKQLFEQLGCFNGICTQTQLYMDAIFSPGNTHFHLRHLAEEDPSLKQIIPYVIFRCNDAVFSYVRGKKAGENRLVGNRSIGIGGHVNPIDLQESSTQSDVSDSLATYMKAVRREIDEEIQVDEDIDPQVVVLLNDDTNRVGSVHFGIIHICDLSEQCVKKREQQITESGFVSIAQLAGPRRRELESWSQIAIDYLVENSGARS